MNPDIERLCRAICGPDGVDPDKPCIGLGGLIPEGETLPAWRVREAYVRAILAELRKPSERMQEAADKAHIAAIADNVIDGKSVPLAPLIWQAMLDSITEEDDEQG